MTSEAAQPAPRRRGRPGNDQATVLREAIELFNLQGYDATSMGDLAARLGFTKSALYHHVPSKEHLLQQALDEALDSLATVVAAARSETDATAIERLRHAVRGSVDTLIEHLPAVTLLLRVRGNSPAELAALARRRELDAALAELVAQAAAEGGIRTDIPPDLISRLLFGMVNSLSEWVRPSGRTSPEAIAEALTAIAFEGLLAP
ncbi:TetR/AcrR family transcriptional regulator [Flexivirga caeni]|uniref:TetR/AcrR family transcriptional regulator n=1 Tax=Flexivirga caeni TaxID=2294115 RepID=A0A3M9MIQ3_9MICO|nr:TetR/AcrR family transcriptional regulator [Flexivirga caeni]RNI25384.1 TetR/AcrR family transcriptional regulator [Flexivirga caeni]